MRVVGETVGRVDICGERVEDSFLVIPFELDSNKKFAFPIDCDVVIFLEGLDEVICVCVANNFDPKVVDDEGKRCWSPDVTP